VARPHRDPAVRPRAQPRGADPQRAVRGLSARPRGKYPRRSRMAGISLAATAIAHTCAMPSDALPPLIVAISSRALFDLEDSHSLFESAGIEAYAEHQRAKEDEILEPGIAFPLVRKLLALNEGAAADAPRVEVILLSRNSADTGLRIF